MSSRCSGLRCLATWPQRLILFLSVLRRYHQAILYRRASRFSGAEAQSGLPISERLLGFLAARISSKGRAARRKRRPGLYGHNKLVQLAELLGEPGRLPNKRQIAELSAALRRIDRNSDRSLAQREFSPAERRALLELEYSLHIAQASLWFSHESPPINASEGGDRATLVFDARCLQHEDFRRRGVGLHSKHVLAALRDMAAGSMQLVLLLDPTMGPVDIEISPVDRCAFSCADIDLSSVKLFVCAAPMTARLGPIIPLLLAPHIRRIAVVYDFIPARFAHQYLRSASDCIAYHARCMALPFYHSFLPISKATADELFRALPFVDPARVLATGVADPLSDATAACPETSLGLPQRYLVAPTGGEARKNLLLVIAGEALNRLLGEEANRIVVVGSLAPAQQKAVLKLARHSGISASEILFLSNLPAGDLKSVYSRAQLCIVPSFAEGFSIPVAEAIHCQTPVVASDIPSHRELLGAGPWLACPSSAINMACAMRMVIRDRESVLQAQRLSLGDRADPSAVGGRIMQLATRLLAAPGAKGPDVRYGQRHGRPRIAVATPWPPDRSGIADYSRHTLTRVADLADVTILTNSEPTCDQPADHGSMTFRTISAAAYLDPQYDRILTVLGNSHFHLAAFEYVMDLGGPVLAHDNRMIEFYWHFFGPDRAARVLSSDVCKVAPSHLKAVLIDLDKSPSAAYGEIGRIAEPLLVHSRKLQERLARETSAKVKRLRFVPYRSPSTGVVEARGRQEAKRRRAINGNVLNVATFGIMDRRTKGADVLVEAMAWLELWGVPALLHIVGSAPPPEREQLERLAMERAISHRIMYHDHVGDAEYSDMLLAADVAVQLRMSSMLTISGAMLDCIAFGVPTIVTQSMIDDLGAPSYVSAVPDRVSPLLVAEAVAARAHLRDAELEEIERQRRAYLAESSETRYAGALLAALGLAHGTVQ